MQRRMRLIPFRACFLSRADTNLDKALIAESAGVFNLLMRRYAALAANGWKVEVPKAVLEASADYIRENQWLATFLSEEAVPDPDGRITAADLFSRFKRWADARRKFTHVSQDSLVREMKAAGHAYKRFRVAGKPSDHPRPFGFVGLALADTDGFGQELEVVEGE
jgi:phage/plasmid-associated DNA primase